MVILEAEGQILAGKPSNLSDIICMVDVKIGGHRFSDVRMVLSIEDPRVVGVLIFDKINTKAIELVIK
ncbi:MAG: hypothetical protein AABX00_00190 [Nanoarchaeota archaeon]